MKVSQIVSFSKESFFNGAVQTEWFYDDSKVGAIAESYVFHGPKYYGVSNTDVSAGAHRLLDTASFAKNLADKLYCSKPDNSFVMTIAGYGTGKSHLAVCLGALFSGKSDLSEKVIQNISSVDAEIGQYIKDINTSKNLVIVLNGMNNFNLDAEILRCARLSLSRFGISDKLLQKLTKSYDIAKRFVENMFSLFEDKFNSAATRNGLNLTGVALKNYLLSHAESDSNVLEIINVVYESVNGDRIAWDRGLSAGDVLLVLQEELCGEGKPFNKILLLFDEFGRYIEYTAANPAIAGDAALQQIFEAIQTANGKIIFAGFIQNELKAYLNRIEKTANVTRYIDRYRTACENLFLSSNFETILANILKKNVVDFDRVVDGAISRYSNYHSKIRSVLSRWDKSAVKKSVWTNSDSYNSVILKGCYPLHPITVWLLSSSHQWMQQRSTLAFVAEMFEQISSSYIEGTWLPYIYPVQLIDSGIFNEMLNSEEKGLVSSQYCMLYRDILVKIGDKLTALEKTVLQSVLVINIGRMSFWDKEDAITAIRYCSNLAEDEIKFALKSLEEMHGVVAFDDHAKTFDLIAEANGFNEFKRVFARHRMGVRSTIDDLDEDILIQMNLTTPVETSFGQDNQISSTEWGFTKQLIDSNNISESFLRSAIRSTTENCDGEKLRGVLIYAYCHENAESEIARISSLYRSLSTNNYPVIILFLNDSDGEILSALTIKKALQKFSMADRERFKKHIADQQHSQNNKIIRKFTNCVSQKSMICDTGIETYSVRINALCTQCFSRLYKKVVSFPFDGFETKIKFQAKGTLVSICVGLLNQTLTNAQVYSSLTPKDKNRVAAVMSTKSTHSWKVFDDNCQLVESGHPIIRSIVNEVTEKLESGEPIYVYTLFGQYLQAPYGLNENSLSLLVSYFIAYYGNKYLYTIANERLSERHWTDPKGKLKLPEIKKIRIEKNKNINLDLVGELCKKILKTTFVEQCADLKNELENMILQEGETEQNKFLVAQAKVHVDEGIRLNNIIYEKISKIQLIISETKQKFSISKILKALETVPQISPIIEEGSIFVYSNDYIKILFQLHNDLKKLLEQSYVSVIKKAKCDITELSQFKNIYSKYAKTLRENGFEEFAIITENRIRELETELLAKQRYESSLVECEKDLTLGFSVVKLRECEELKSRLIGWVSFLDGAKDLPASISAPLKERIAEALAIIDKRIRDITEEYHTIISSVANAKTVSELRYIDSNLNRLSQQQLPEKWEHHIFALRDAISNAIVFIDGLPQELDALELAISQISIKDNPYCIEAITNCAQTIRSNLEKEEHSWIEKYVFAAEKSYQTMSPQECTSWLEKTKSLPGCLGARSKQRYSTVKELIERQLHAARVEGLLSMYDALTQQEKDEFKKLLARR
ncbi:MAG: hypothetical protein U0M02_00540 [Acutalibacteraceae bacterium]|nr:hypothetical protein [Acutalibacteraceae bacterium]